MGRLINPYTGRQSTKEIKGTMKRREGCLSLTDTYGMVLEGTDYVPPFICTGGAAREPNNCSAEAELDDALQREIASLDGVRTKVNVSKANVDQSQNSCADSQSGERAEGLLRVAFHHVSVLCSAGFYLFDFISNILVLKVYWKEIYIDGTFEGSTPGSIGNEITPFVICLGFLISSQIIALVVFKLNLPPEEYPLRSAGFLPLVQLYRLLKEIRMWKHKSSSKRWQATETESLFAIMSALETSLQIPIQISYIALAGLGDRDWNPSPVLVMSVVSSFLSGGYNAGLAIMYNTSLRWGVMLNAFGIAGGLYTIGSMLLRSLALAHIGLASEVSGLDHRGILGGYFCLWSPVFYIFGLIALGKTAKLFTWEAQLRAGISMFFFVLGPMYPVLEGLAPKVESVSLKVDTIVRLFVAAISNFLLDVLTLSIAAGLNWGICRYSSENIYFPDRPYLTSTLKCSRFIALASFAAVLIVGSTLVLCFLLLTSSLESMTGGMLVEISRLIRIGSKKGTTEGVDADPISFNSSGSGESFDRESFDPESQTISDNMKSTELMRMQLIKFSLYNAFYGKDSQVSTKVYKTSDPICTETLT